MLKRLLACSRVAIPLMLGVCIGIALSFMLLPLLEESACKTQHIGAGKRINLYKSKPANPGHPYLEGVDLDSFRGAEFEPKVVTTEKSDSQMAKKPVRNRFIQSELNLKEPLFIAYVTSPEQLYGRAASLDKSLAGTRERVAYKFFANTRIPAGDANVPLVTFNLLEPNKLPLLTIKYLTNQLQVASLYKYYLILPDTSYVRADLLRQKVLALESEKFVGFARPTDRGSACDLSVGFLLSQDALYSIGESMTACETEYSQHTDGMIALETCITSAVGQQCTTIADGSGTAFHHLPLPVGKLSLTDDVRESPLLTGITSSTDVYQLRRLFAQEELADTINTINDIRLQIAATFVDRGEHVPWDSPARRPLHTTNRYDILRWTLVEGNVSYMAYDYENGEPLKAATASLLDEMVSSAMAFVNSGESRYELVELVHAYTRADPTRGQDTLLTLRLNDGVLGKSVLKTFEMVRPRSAPYVVPRNLTAWSTPVHILVPFVEDDSEELDVLINSFQQEFGDSEELFLHLVFGSGKPSGDMSAGDYTHLQDYALQIGAELGIRDRVRVLAPANSSLPVVDLLTWAIKSLPDDVIVLTSTLTTTFSSDFLSRVYENTIKGRQVYAPIAFWEYEPALIYSKRRADRVEVSRNIGHFGEQWYDHLAFFSDDYKSAVRSREGSFAEPVDVLTSVVGLDVLRAPDPELLVRNHSPDCARKNPSDRSKCSVQFLDNTGSGPILAKSLLNDRLIDVYNEY